MLLFFTLSAAFAQSAQVGGEWYISRFGIEGSVILNDDGTYSIDLSNLGEEEPRTGTWCFDGTDFIFDAETDSENVVPFDAQNNTFELQGMLCSREHINVYTPAAVRTDAVPKDFSGHWEASTLVAFGFATLPEENGIALTLDIDETAASIRFEQEGSLRTADVPMALIDGALTISLSGDDDTDDAVFTVQALEDGTLSASFEYAEEDAVCILCRAQSE